MRFCVLIPAYNAAQQLPELFARLFCLVDRSDVIVVDDGSNDDTSSVAEAAGVRLVRHDKNEGKGAALKAGFAMALAEGYDAVVTIDADLQHPPELIPRFVDALEEGFDLVVGNRLDDVRSMPIERRVSNLISTLATSILAGRKLLDSQCGFRAIRSWVLRRARLFSKRYELESELLVEAARMGAKIAFVKIPTIYNGNKSYFHPLVDTMRFVAFLFTYYPRRWLSRKS